MPSDNPIIIKKYANRRLYHTGTSAYVTLEDLARLVKNGEDFLVQDAKTGEDITRSVLGQIIFEHENRGNNGSLLPIAFLRQLIQFYGDSMQAILPSYLESSLATFTRDQEKLREHLSKSLQENPLGLMEEQARRNMELFSEAMRMWMPFPPKPEGSRPGTSERNGKDGGKTQRADTEKREAERDGEIEALKKQLQDIQKTLEGIAGRQKA
ncbi:polyhydroxyalkanoate synthesis repressor PhaR [Faunimonas pinastri]|uniref:Polyhydroxyalkanoate synthesis repressor PhaR n=1 Tax=Faunimonas pinastri TaxID=1855383 RepID=A0A1H9HV01_9HYPH|nr:polyhydroxyalkanoate synthesis repressor PhaR [Faunimonas pinastri]SEQ66085.1 polyhydroxyalkanoate synthesis repressor PhaR [Faunimonas pinastri]